MFERLQKKWKVNGLQLTLIICTFAIGGSLTGFVGKKIMNYLSIPQDWLWAIIYIVLITIIWPLAVLVISFPFGQFRFFVKYIRKIGMKMGFIRNGDKSSYQLKNNSKYSETEHTSKLHRFEQVNMAIFASGTGSNAQKIIDYFSKHPSIRVALIITDKKKAGVLQIAAAHHIPSIFLEKEKFAEGDTCLNVLNDYQINFIVLAGFLRKIPPSIIKEYSERIVNIHPALLPKFGGKGMYGHFVHDAVIAAGEKESGITIHYVDEVYDHGKTIFQVTCPVLENDTAEALSERIKKLEHENFPKVIEDVIFRQKD